MYESPVLTRILKGVSHGYEESYTQYQVFANGEVWITQMALLDNMAKAMGGQRPFLACCGTPERGAEYIAQLIDNRLENTDIVEVTPSLDPRKCPDCEHFKWEHGPELPGCVAGFIANNEPCGCKLTWEGENDN